MAKIEDISAQSFQFTQGAIPSTPSTGRTKLYAKSDGKIYSQGSEGVENVLTNDTRYKGLRLARQIILTEAAATIEIDTDSDGNPLNSELGGELLFYSGANSTVENNKQLLMQINSVASGSYWWSSTYSSTYFQLGYAAEIISECKADISILNSNLIINSRSSYRYSTAGNMLMYNGGMTTPQTAVTAIKLFLSAGTFPADTVVEWWERG